MCTWSRASGSTRIWTPNGKYRDQVDASSGAFNKLAVPAFNLFSGAWG